jgi:hypothetical protein
MFNAGGESHSLQSPLGLMLFYGQVISGAKDAKPSIRVLFKRSRWTLENFSTSAEWKRIDSDGKILKIWLPIYRY